MNDILARFLVITGSEVDSYWLFKLYMDKKREDFLEDTMMTKVGKEGKATEWNSWLLSFSLHFRFGEESDHGTRQQAV